MPEQIGYPNYNFVLFSNMLSDFKFEYFFHLKFEYFWLSLEKYSNNSILNVALCNQQRTQNFLQGVLEFIRKRRKQIRLGNYLFSWTYDLMLFTTVLFWYIIPLTHSLNTLLYKVMRDQRAPTAAHNLSTVKNKIGQTKSASGSSRQDPKK